jgi:hypothetical protein
VPLFSGRRVLVVVFNQLRGMSLILTRESANGFAEPRRAWVVNDPDHSLAVAAVFAERRGPL